MSYRITGFGLGPVLSKKATLGEAARTAHKMADQGVKDIHVFDRDGREVSDAELTEAWWSHEDIIARIDADAPTPKPRVPYK